MMKASIPALLLALTLSPALSAADSHTIELSHKGSGTLYVQTTLDENTQSSWLVDTGSDYSVMDRASLESLLTQGRARYVKQLRGKMADGSERTLPLFMVDSLELGNGCTVENVKVAVLPNSTRSIMGLSALRQLAPFSVSFDPPQLTVSGCKPSVAALEDESLE